MNTTTTKKPKVQRTNRIEFGIMTIYVSSLIVRESRDLTVRLGQKLFPVKGKNWELRTALRELSRKHPDHFTSNGRCWLEQ